MTVVVAWRWSFGEYKTSPDFSSRRAALDDMCDKCNLERSYAENFVYSVCIPLPQEWRKG